MKMEQKVEQKSRPAFIKVSEIDEGGIIKAIEYGYSVYEKEKDADEEYTSYFIPAFNIHFFAKNEEDKEKIEHAVMTSFFNFWVKNQGKKAFIQEIKRLGFVEQNPKAKTKKDIRFSIVKPSIPNAFKKENKYSSKKIAA